MAKDDEEEEYYSASDFEDDCGEQSEHGSDAGAEDDMLEDVEIIGCSTQRSTYSIISMETLLAEQNEKMNNVIDLFGVKEHQARTLLIFYRWNIERICDLLERRGRERLLEEAGVPVASRRDETLDAPSGASSSSITCNVCFEDVSPGAASAMDCGHCFCNDCWSQHFVININNGGSRTIRCMAPKCRAICDEAVVRSLVGGKDAAAAERFDRSLLESYVEDNDNVKWCPSAPHCGNAVRVEDTVVPCEVVCDCGHEFCFNCSAEPHSPATCAMRSRWVKRCDEDSESAKWLNDNVKSCPKCHKPIEKRDGCNLVRCVCGQHFCWICGCATGYSHTWNQIQNHVCNHYKEKANIEKARRSVFRFMHYYNRYRAHRDSLAMEKLILDLVRAKVSAADEEEESYAKDCRWMLEGVRTLLTSRRLLRDTYTFAFYMFGDEVLDEGEMTKSERDVKMNLFEDYQQQLEANVERLSGALSEESYICVDDDRLMKKRERVVNLSTVVNNFCKHMYAFIESDLLGALKGGVH